MLCLFAGESVYSSLHGSSVDVNVRLDRSSLKLENTYIGLSTQRYYTLRDNSPGFTCSVACVCCVGLLLYITGVKLWFTTSGRPSQV